MILRSRGLTLDCTSPIPGGAHVMGILNVTPDSFSDGGHFMEIDTAMKRAEVMIAEGAVIIDVGGASSRPGGAAYGEGAHVVPVEEELERVLPVVKGIASRWPEIWISVDTCSAHVAEHVLDAGAHIINDITGLRLRAEIARQVASADGVLVLMHSVGRPGDMPHVHPYKDVIAEVKDSLRQSIAAAEKAGVDGVIVDPGFGFGKNIDDNLRLIGSLRAFQELSHPVLVGISRKSTIGSILGTGEEPVPVTERLFGTLGATAVALQQGAQIIRTHDVGPTVELLKVMDATLRAATGTCD